MAQLLPVELSALASSLPANRCRPANHGGPGATRVGVTFIPFFYGRAPLVATEREVLALFCTPAPWGR